MALRPNLKLMAAVLALLPASREAWAGQPQNMGETGAESSISCKADAIFTDRLRGSRLRMWNSVRELVFARNDSGRFRHPTLIALWHEADGSGHAIHIELSKQECDRAGQIRIESSDVNDRRHVVAIEINLYAIQHASVAEIARRPNGWIPFAGLGLKERCAQVLGHELAHAVRMFRDPEYLRLFRDMEQAGRDVNWHAPDVKERLNRLTRLTSEFEKPVEAVELQVWRELQVRKRPNARLPSSHGNLRHIKAGDGVVNMIVAQPNQQLRGCVLGIFSIGKAADLGTSGGSAEAMSRQPASVSVERNPHGGRGGLTRTA